MNQNYICNYKIFCFNLQVCWGSDLQDGELNFFSVSSDGQVFNWVLMQNELAQTLVITLYLDMDPIPGPDGTMLRMTGTLLILFMYEVYH